MYVARSGTFFFFFCMHALRGVTALAEGRKGFVSTVVALCH